MRPETCLEVELFDTIVDAFDIESVRSEREAGLRPKARSRFTNLPS